MKTLVLTALMGATLTTVSANTYTPISNTAEIIHIIDDKSEEFKAQISKHQWNVDVVWEQYERAVSDIKSKRGSVADLLSQMNNLIKYYQDDINEGVRVEASKEAIAEIRDSYRPKIKRQSKVEAKQIARMQALLEIELEKEEHDFNELKRTYAEQINEQTRPLIRSAERQFAQSSARIEALKGAISLASL